MKSSINVGPRRPALRELWLSPTATPWFVVRARPVESTLTRVKESFVGFDPGSAGAPDFGVALTSLSVLPVTVRLGGSTCCPSLGLTAAAR